MHGGLWGDRGRALTLAVGLHAGRFGVIMLALAVAPALGLRGWYAGLLANLLCCAYAVAVVLALRLQGRLGLARWRSALALWWLCPIALEALSWLVPGDGAGAGAPGPGWWALSMLLVGVNEELVSRGAVLTVLSERFAALPAVLLTAALFGLQHLSALVTSGAPLGDTLWRVGTTAIYGFALAAYQWRFCWLWPLILLHAGSDLAGVLTPGAPPDWLEAAVLVVLVGSGVVHLRQGRSGIPTPSTTRAGAAG